MINIAKFVTLSEEDLLTINAHLPENQRPSRFYEALDDDIQSELVNFCKHLEVDNSEHNGGFPRPGIEEYFKGRAYVSHGSVKTAMVLAGFQVNEDTLDDIMWTYNVSPEQTEFMRNMPVDDWSKFYDIYKDDSLSEDDTIDNHNGSFYDWLREYKLTAQDGSAGDINVMRDFQEDAAYSDSTFPKHVFSNKEQIVKYLDYLIYDRNVRVVPEVYEALDNIWLIYEREVLSKKQY